MNDMHHKHMFFNSLLPHLKYPLRHVVPQPSFEETLVMFDHFLDFDWLVEDGVPRRNEYHRISLVLKSCGPIKGFNRVYVMDYGMLAHGFTHD
jgi:hypothetical protein